MNNLKLFITTYINNNIVGGRFSKYYLKKLLPGNTLDEFITKFCISCPPKFKGERDTEEYFILKKDGQ